MRGVVIVATSIAVALAASVVAAYASIPSPSGAIDGRSHTPLFRVRRIAS
jgi:hypothetical protein